MLLMLVVAGAAALAVTMVESGGGTRPLGLLVTLAPMALAAATGLRFSRARLAGAVDGWETLGGAPAGLVGPLMLAAVGIGLCVLVGPVPSAPLPLSAPVEAAASVWWVEGWTAPPGERWTVPPGELGLGELWDRWLETPPPGARGGVDGAELLRRVSLVLAWPLAVLAGAWRPLQVGGREHSSTSAALFACAVVAGWMSFGALAVGAYSMT